MLLIIVLYFYIQRILHRQGWKLFRLEAYIQTRYKLKLYIIAYYIKTSTNYFGNQRMLDGIAKSEILRVLSNHSPTVCGRILWIILIVGQDDFRWFHFHRQDASVRLLHKTCLCGPFAWFQN